MTDTINSGNRISQEYVEKSKEEKKEKQMARIPPLKKCALLLLAIGGETASEVLKYFDEEEVEKLSIEIASLKNVPADMLNWVIEEFYEMLMANDYIVQGGIDFAKDILEKAWGHRKAGDVLKRVEAATEVSAFYLLQTVDDKQLLNFLQNEHPQTAALIMANIKPAQAASILSELPEESQYEIAYRLGVMEKTSPELIREIENVLREQIGTVFGGDLSKTGGAEAVAQILNSSGRSTEKSVMEYLQDRDPELAEEITGFMFLFEDIVGLSDATIQRLLRECDSKTLALGLKAGSSQLKEKIFKNMSERAAGMLKEEIELLGAVRLKEVEASQKQILEVMYKLEENGEINLTRGEDEEVID